MKKILVTERAPKAVGAYSQGVEINNTYYFSGQIGLNPQTGELENGFQSQLERVMSNIDGLLSSQGLKKDHIVKTTVFMVDLTEFPKVNQAFEKFFGALPYPARSTIEVKGLPKAALVEVEVIAVKF